MTARLILFILGYGVILMIPGGGLALLGYKLLKPRLERRCKLKLAMERAQRILVFGPHTQVCPFCLESTDEDKDVYTKEQGWHHTSCLINLLK